MKRQTEGGDAACTVAGMLNSFYTQVDGPVKSHDKCVNLQKNIFLHLLIGAWGGGGLLIEEAVKPIKIQLKVQCQFYSLLHILQSGPVSQIQVSDGLVLAPGP